MSQSATQLLGKSALHIARYLILHSDKLLTPLHVDKLVFFSHGWTLGLFRRPLITDTVEAWKYGPVIPSVYHAYKKYGGQGLGPHHLNMSSDTTIIDKLFTSEEKEVMDTVLQIYNYRPAAELIAITHEEGSPWSQHYVEDQRYTEIPIGTIQAYYENKANENA